MLELFTLASFFIWLNAAENVVEALVAEKKTKTFMTLINVVRNIQRTDFLFLFNKVQVKRGE